MPVTMSESVIEGYLKEFSERLAVNTGEFSFSLPFDLEWSGKQSYLNPHLASFDLYVANVCVGVRGTHVCISKHKFGVTTNHEKLRCDWAPMSNRFYLT